jgi:hypothetical protein
VGLLCTVRNIRPHNCTARKAITASSTEKNICVASKALSASQRNENKKSVEMVSLNYDTVKNIKIN